MCACMQMTWAVITTIYMSVILDFASAYNFVALCRFGFVTSIMCGGFLVLQQKKLVSLINIIYMSYVLFQFGIPIVYAVDPGYSNFYVNLFNITTIFTSAKYSIYSIIIFAMFLSFSLMRAAKNRESKIIFQNCRAMRDEKFVKGAGLIILILSGFVAIPLYTAVALLSIKNGFSQATRGILSISPIFNLARALFMPSCTLVLCYDKRRNACRYIVMALFIIVCVENLIIGNRAEGIAWLLVYIYMNYKTDFIKNKWSRNIFIFLGILFLMIASVYIAQSRISKDSLPLVSIIKNGILRQFVGEAGFNFISICLITDYVPRIAPFRYGTTYLHSILTMIPKSLDMGLLSNVRDNMPGIWLVKINHEVFNGLLDFGTGFSFNAETYMNFGRFGLIVVAFFATIIGKIINERTDQPTPWQMYIQLIALMALQTFPRRTFSEMLSSLKYSILFIGAYLIILYKIYNKRIGI